VSWRHEPAETDVVCHLSRRHTLKKLVPETCTMYFSCARLSWSHSASESTLNSSIISYHIVNLTQVHHSFLHQNNSPANHVVRFLSLSHAWQFLCWNYKQETYTTKNVYGVPDWPARVRRASFWCKFLADRTNGRAYATVLRLSVCRLSMTLCIVAKRGVLEQKLLLRAYRKSYMRNRLVTKWMTLTFV